MILKEKLPMFKNFQINVTLLSLIFLMSISVNLGQVNQSMIADLDDEDNEVILKNQKINSYPSLNPIIVNGNANFTTYGVFTGSGTSIDPYKLENYSIQTSGGSGIKISNTECIFYNSECGN